MSTTGQALKQFATDYSKAVANKTGFLPQVLHDPKWCSPCEFESAVSDQMIQWQWQAQVPPLSFDDIEAALELNLHPDIKQYYNTMYCGSLFATIDNQQVELLQVWNEPDFDRLSQNIIGHILMQRRLQQDLTVFIGCVVNSEQMLSLDNQTGQVIVEVAGSKQRDVIAASISDLLEQAQPLVEPESELEYQEPTPQQAGLIPRLKEIFNSLLGR